MDCYVYVGVAPLNGKVCSSFTVQRYAFILFPPTENFYLSIEEIYEAPDFPLNTGILHRNVVLEKSEGTTNLLFPPANRRTFCPLISIHKREG